MRRAKQCAISLVLAAGLALAAPPAAPAQSGDGCSIPKGPGGLIRGDRVPSGCVMRPEEPAPSPSELGRHRGSELIGVGVPIFFTTRPVFLILTDGFGLGVGPPRTRKFTVSRADRRPRRDFGPLFRHFGPVTRHFGPADRGSRDPEPRPRRARSDRGDGP